VSIVAPTILPNEDLSLQDAAIKILCKDNCKLYPGHRAIDVMSIWQSVGSSNSLIMESVDGQYLVLCIHESNFVPAGTTKYGL
jgi:hypothetical protein